MAFVWTQQPIKLIIQGPVLSAGETFSNWGMDTSFYRDHSGRLALPGSHVRGKLKEALNDILSMEEVSDNLLNKWFGRQSHKETGNREFYFPHRGTLKITDFLLSDKIIPHEQIKTRIRIEPETGIVSSGALMNSEMPFPSGKETLWTGFLEFFSAQEDVEIIIKYIHKAFLFITALGAEKTTGYGRLIKVSFDEKKQTVLPEKQVETKSYSCIEIAIAPEEAFMIGGVRHTQNVFKSETVIPGKVVKGALATGLNRLAGNADLNRYIDEKNNKVSSLYPELSKYFGELVFLHAVPCLDKYRRPATTPLSGVVYGDNYEDITFKSPMDIFARENSPVTFQVDWKTNPGNIPNEYIRPELEFFSVTRTAIESESRKAEESKLYSFHMVKPLINESTQVYWNTKILFPHGLKSETRQTLAGEIKAALPLGLKYIGKRQSRTIVTEQPGKSFPVVNIPQGSKFAIILQTQALMIDPAIMAESAGDIFDDRKVLHGFYQDFWTTVFGKDTVKLNYFYAAQELQGGYLGMRFMQKQYSPFYLTSQGSVFILTSCNKQINSTLNKLSLSGLPLPTWVQGIRSPHHPFAPQSGYGEIKIIQEEGKANEEL